MRSKKDERTTHERWCDSMVAKAKANRVTERPVVCVLSRPKKAEPTYTNYELKKMFGNYLTK